MEKNNNALIIKKNKIYEIMLFMFLYFFDLHKHLQQNQQLY